MQAFLADEASRPALYMVWSQDWILVPQPASVDEEYELRLYREGDEESLSPLFHAEGWHIEQAGWQGYLDLALPHGLFVLRHRLDDRPVGTVGAIHNPRGGRYYFPFGGELAYLVVQSEYRGRGFGPWLCLRALQRLRQAGYQTIWTGVQGTRLAAIKTYFRVGFRPLLHQPHLAQRWQQICEHLGWPYEPERWPESVPGGANL